MFLANRRGVFLDRRGGLDVLGFLRLGARDYVHAARPSSNMIFDTINAIISQNSAVRSRR